MLHTYFGILRHLKKSININIIQNRIAHWDAACGAGITEILRNAHSGMVAAFIVRFGGET